MSSNFNSAKWKIERDTIIYLIKDNPGCTADELCSFSELDPETFVALLIQASNDKKIRREGEQYSMSSKTTVDIWWPIE